MHVCGLQSQRIRSPKLSKYLISIASVIRISLDQSISLHDQLCGFSCWELDIILMTREPYILCIMAKLLRAQMRERLRLLPLKLDCISWAANYKNLIHSSHVYVLGICIVPRPISSNIKLNAQQYRFMSFMCQSLKYMYCLISLFFFVVARNTCHRPWEHFPRKM